MALITDYHAIIETLKEDGATDNKSMMLALEDGEYLAGKNWNESAVIQLHFILHKSPKDLCNEVFKP